MLHAIDLHANKILLVGCGGASVVNFPGWVFALKRLTTAVTFEAMLTGSAKKLVAKDAVMAVSGRPYYSDGDTFSTQGEVLHRHLAEWPDIVILAPMTLNTLANVCTVYF